MLSIAIPKFSFKKYHIFTGLKIIPARESILFIFVFTAPGPKHGAQ